MPLHTPLGWIALQERAKHVRDPHELVDLIGEMNQLLSEYEMTAGDGDGHGNGNGNGRRPAKPKTAAKKAAQKKPST
jgi:hypothetical protein